MTRRNYQLPAGLAGYIRFIFVDAPDSVPALSGYALVDGQPVALPVRDDDTLVLPPTIPEGDWPYEMRADGARLLHGHLIVTPPVYPADAGGSVNWSVDVGEEMSVVKVALNAGAPGRDGRDGPPGRDGRDGIDGATPEIGEGGTWVIGGEDTGRPSVVTIDHAERTTTQTPAAGLLDNYEIQGWQMAVAKAGVITDIAVEACDNREIIRPGPRWLKLWILDRGARYHLATSTESRTQTIGQTAVWPIHDVHVEAGQILVITVHDAPDGTGYGDCSQLSCRAVANTAADGGIITGADGLSLVAGWLPRYTVRMRVIDGVSTRGVPIVTRPDMEAYVAEYVAAHAPAIDLSDYQGPIHLRDEVGHDVLRTGTGTADNYRHLYLGADRIDVGLGEECSQVVISAEVDAPNYYVRAAGFISDYCYAFRNPHDESHSLGLYYGRPGHTDDSAVYITHAGMFDIADTSGMTSISVNWTSVFISGTNIYIGDQYKARLILSYNNIEMQADQLRLSQTGYGYWSQGALHVDSSGYVVISPSDPA